MGRHLAVLGLAACLLPLAACKKKVQSDEDVKVIIENEGKIAREESNALAQRGNLQRERSVARDKRAELLAKKEALPETDATGRAAIDKEASELASVEAKLANQELALNKRLDSLLGQREGLPTGAGKEVLVLRRESSVAVREKDLASRESEIARREKILAAREQAFADRQAKGCRAAPVFMAAAPPPSGGGGGATRKDVEPVYKAALAAMQSKGILTADLPAGADRLVTEVRHGVAKGDFVRAKYAADTLLSTVRQMKIDRGFIGAKVARLSAQYRSSPPSADRRAKLTPLFSQATGAYQDGRFGEANKLLNRIYALMH